MSMPCWSHARCAARARSWSGVRRAGWCTGQAQCAWFRSGIELVSFHLGQIREGERTPARELEPDRVAVEDGLGAVAGDAPSNPLHILLLAHYPHQMNTAADSFRSQSPWGPQTSG